MQSLISQSFEIFNVYGKEPEAVGSIMKAFALVLENETARDIGSGFKEWMKQNSTMPAPADILKIIQGYRKDRAEAERYSALKLSAPAKEPSARKVQWAYKIWSEFTEDDKTKLSIHLIELGNKAPSYIQYLQEFYGAPRGFENNLV